jgi:hypothetical protein
MRRRGCCAGWSGCTPGAVAERAASVLAAALLVGAAQAETRFTPPVSPEGELAAPWRVVGLPDQKLPFTRFAVESVDGVPALRIEADGSYGNLVHDISRLPVPRRLQWRWRIEEANTSANLRRREGDDAAAKVCLAFDIPLARLPFLERTMLDVARRRTGQPLPSATLCWVWSVFEPPGTLLHNPYTGRVRYIVLRNAGDGTGRWAEEARDVRADLQRAFGEEYGDTLPPWVGVLVGGDADNTGATTRAYVAAMRLE